MSACFTALGGSLLLGKSRSKHCGLSSAYCNCPPDNAASEEDVGVAFLESGQVEKAASHLERALELDPLLLPAATTLEEVYRRRGEGEKASALAGRIRSRLDVPIPSGGGR